MFYLKHSGQEKWMAGGARALVPNMDYFEQYAQMVQHLPEGESFMELKVAFERLSELGCVKTVPHQTGTALLDFVKKSTTKMQDVMMFERDPIEIIKAQINFIEVLERVSPALIKLTDTLRSQKDMTAAQKDIFTSFNLYDDKSYRLGTYRPTMIAAKPALEKIIKDTTKFEVVERNAQNSYIQKKAWAIFSDNGYGVGFKNKDGNLGDISSARLFDSDKGALRTAGSMRLDNFEIVEVEVTLKRRTNMKPEFQNEKFLEALATIERDKIDNFLMEVGAERVEAALKKRVNKI